MENYQFIKRKHFGMRRKLRFLGLDEVTQRGDLWIRVEDVDGYPMPCKQELSEMTIQEVSVINQRREEAIKEIVENHKDMSFYQVELGGHKTSDGYNRIYLRPM